MNSIPNQLYKLEQQARASSTHRASAQIAGHTVEYIDNGRDGFAWLFDGKPLNINVIRFKLGC